SKSDFYLLSVLCHRNIRFIHFPSAIIYLFLFISWCGWYLFRGSFSRPIWQAEYYFMFACWSCSLHYITPFCQLMACHCISLYYWHITDVELLGHCRLCTITCARKNWYHVRAHCWISFLYGGNRYCCTRLHY